MEGTLGAAEMAVVGMVVDVVVEGAMASEAMAAEATGGAVVLAEVDWELVAVAAGWAVVRTVVASVDFEAAVALEVVAALVAEGQVAEDLVGVGVAEVWEAYSGNAS